MASPAYFGKTLTRFAPSRELRPWPQQACSQSVPPLMLAPLTRFVPSRELRS